MEIEVQKDGDITVLNLRGAFRLGPAVDSFRAAMDEALRSGSKVIVNMTEVNSLDSSGIGALVRSHTAAKQHGGAVRLVNLTRLVVQTLKAVGLLSVFEVHPDNAAAVASFGNAEATE